MSKFRGLIPIVVALIIAIVASGYLYQWVKKRTGLIPDVQEALVDTQDVVVAVSSIAWGTKLQPELIKVVKYIKDSAPDGNFTLPENLVDRVLVSSVSANEPILETKLAPIAVNTGGVIALIEPGKRALAVKGDKIIGLAGFIKPGNSVDVLVSLSFKNPDTGKNQRISKIILENIKVLATGAQLQQNEEGDQLPVDVYTLEVTPEEGEKLTLATTQGTIKLALRNPLDKTVVLTAGATADDTLASYQPYFQLEEKDVEPPASPKAQLRPMLQSIPASDFSGVKKISQIQVPYKMYKVKVIRGTEISEKEFRGDH